MQLRSRVQYGTAWPLSNAFSQRGALPLPPPFPLPRSPFPIKGSTHFVLKSPETVNCCLPGTAATYHVQPSQTAAWLQEAAQQYMHAPTTVLPHRVVKNSHYTAYAHMHICTHACTNTHVHTQPRQAAHTLTHRHMMQACPVGTL